MKTTSIKTLYLGEDELKQALIDYLEQDHWALASHLSDNGCEVSWDQEKKELVVFIEGEVDDRQETAIGDIAKEIVEENAEAYRKLAENKEE